MSLHAYGHRGPCINGRTETLHESINPFGEMVYFAAEKFIFDAMEFRAQALVHLGDELMRESTEYHDWREFGDSIQEAIRDAQKWYDNLGPKVQVSVAARLVSRPAFYANEDAFYTGEVKVYYTIPRWGYYWENGKSVEVCDLSETTTEYEVWVNGENGKDYTEVKLLRDTIPGQDIAADKRRKKEAS